MNDKIKIEKEKIWVASDDKKAENLSKLLLKKYGDKYDIFPVKEVDAIVLTEKTVIKILE